MQQTLGTIIASIFYLLATACIARTFHTDFLGTQRGGHYRSAALWTASIAAAGHAINLAGLINSHADGVLNFSLVSAASASLLAMVMALIGTSLLMPVEKLGIIIFPLAASILLVRPLLPEETHLLLEQAWPMKLHVVISILAFSFLNIAALQAILLALQDWQLRRHHTGGIIRSLPPLQTMETLLFQLIGSGLILLTLSLTTGFLFLDDLFAQHLAHKTVFSIMAWLIFTGLLIGRLTRGWRGMTAIRWTLSGTTLLVLAYFGSKLVLQWILHRD
jgi:ABC-type uncharacterized transport system permease subunit